MRKFLIFAPGFNENRGGPICLHRLCHELNQLEMTSASLTPHFDTFDISRRSFIKPLGRLIKYGFVDVRSYRTHPDLNTPVIMSPGSGEELDDFVVIYPEIVDGNPLNAQNVVRWLLYVPGGHSGRIHYGTGEMYVRFNSGVGRFEIPGSVTVADQLKIVHYPLDIYWQPQDGSARSGCAYAVRKGRGKPLIHHPPDAICIDGRSHQDVAAILRGVKTFVSYDPYTAYSLFAAISGCDSVVIPDDGVSEDEWYPDPADRYGISYGWDRLDHARKTRSLVRERMLAEQGRNREQARTFSGNVDSYFGAPT